VEQEPADGLVRSRAAARHLRLSLIVSISPWSMARAGAERSTNMWWECSECGTEVERSRARLTLVA
jgi:hypothetical protein